MKTKLILSCFLFFSVLHAQVMWQIKKDTIIKWYYYDGDEFDSENYDSDKWIPHYSWSQVNYDMKYFMSPKYIQQKNGICSLICTNDSGLYQVPDWQFDSLFKKRYKQDIFENQKFKYEYSAGNMWSKRKYKRGFFELRFRTTNEYGMWPAFWMYGDEKDEIDFFELKGERAKDIHADVHCIKGCDSHYKGHGIIPRLFGGWIKTTKDLSETYNVISGEWNENEIKWYLNGEGICYFKGHLNSETMSLILGTGPALDGKAFAPGVNASTKFPNSYDLDYVRVWYAKDENKTEVKGIKHTAFDFEKSDATKASVLKRKINYMYSKKEFGKDEITISFMPKSKNKFVLSSLGKIINYQLIILSTNGNILFDKQIQEPFSECNLIQNTEEFLILKIILDKNRVIEEKIKQSVFE